MADIEALKESFLNMVGSITSHSERRLFFDWILDDVASCLEEEETSEDVIEGRKKLVEMSAHIRSIVPNQEAVYKSEEVFFPSKFAADNDKQMSSANTLHVDGFLYDLEEEVALVKQGDLPRAVCNACGSKDTQSLTYITHSCSKEALECFFTSILPPLSKDSVILDVGSRLGAVIYGAYVFTDSNHIVGVEMNADLCQLQQNVVEKFQMGDRIRIECAEMSTRPDLFSKANVIILNNVFEFFVNDDDLKASMWKFLNQSIKSGTLVVTIPAIEKSIASLNVDFKLSDWLEELPPFRNESKQLLEIEDESAEAHLYRVL